MAKRLFSMPRRTKSTGEASNNNDKQHNPPYRRISAKDILMGRVSDPAIPTLPDRSWRNNTSSKPAPQLPPELPKSKPPPLDPPSEPALPSRPPRNAPPGSPMGQMWYHANMDRKKAETLLRRYNKDGTFIVRDSTKAPGEYSLSLWFGGGIRHLRIRVRHDKKFVLGEEKSDEHAFDTVMELIVCHRKEPIHLKSGGETTLKFECPQL